MPWAAPVTTTTLPAKRPGVTNLGRRAVAASDMARRMVCLERPAWAVISARAASRSPASKALTMSMWSCAHSGWHHVALRSTSLMRPLTPSA